MATIKCITGSLAICLSVGMPAHTFATVTEYTNKPAWQSTVGNNYSSIYFTGYPNNTFITTQYSSLGIVFTDGNDSIQLTPSFITDGAGLTGNNIIHISFSAPMFWIGADFPDALEISLYNQSSLIYTSGKFGGGGVGFFGGLVSTNPFDSVVLLKPAGGDVSIDNLHFGPPIPAPGALALLGAACFFGRRRRR